MLLIRKATINDLESVLSIYSEAREKFAVEKTFQWKNGYPNAMNFISDLNNNVVIVAVVDNTIAGVATIMEQIDVNYENCDTVKWLNDEKYLSIHRIAVGKEFYKKHVGSSLVKYILEYAFNKGIKNVKVDTHVNNHDMKKLIEKYEFKYCGVIKLLDKNELRDAYQRVLYEES